MKLFLISILLSINTWAAEFYIEGEAGLAGQNSIGIRGGISLGVKFEPIIVVAEVQYFRYTTAAFGSDAEFHGFPLGVGVRVPFLEKWRFSGTYYYDNTLYKNFGLFPVSYSIVYDGYSSWRLGVGRNLEHPKWWAHIYYEYFFFNHFKTRTPVLQTGDIAVVDIRSLHLSVTYIF